MVEMLKIIVDKKYQKSELKQYFLSGGVYVLYGNEKRNKEIL